MSKVLYMQPEDIHVGLDFSIKQLEMLRTIINRSEISYNSATEPEVALAIEYSTEFCQLIDKLIDDAERGPR